MMPRFWGFEVVLPEIPIIEVRRDFTTDGRLARACQLRVCTLLVVKSGRETERMMPIDTGAPFSIVPYSLWHGGNLSWQPLGTEFWTPAGVRNHTALTWLGVPCHFGELQIRLIDELNQRSRALRLVAKLPLQPVALHLERAALLGYSFLADNALTMTVTPHRRVNAGIFANIVGHLTIP
jgi:hypothetical protein